MEYYNEYEWLCFYVFWDEYVSCYDFIFDDVFSRNLIILFGEGWFNLMFGNMIWNFEFCYREWLFSFDNSFV